MMRSLILSVVVSLISVSWAQAQRHVNVIQVSGVIGPVTLKQIQDGIETAEADSAECLIVLLDTPGGLLESTQLVIKEILASDVPVVIYIAPSGAGAGSAGVFITMSAHVTAMAPGTNIGAAHPVGIGGGIPDSTMNQKIENFTASYIRSIAAKRGRNADWAERAVRESVAVTEQEAVELNVVDFIAPDLDSLLIRMDGMTVEVLHGMRTLRTRDAEIRQIEMNWRDELLKTISNPNVAYLLMMLGFYGLFFELSNPGSIFPGVAGVICIIVGLFALQTLPINYAGLTLMILGVGLFVAEIYVASHGVLTVGGIIATTLGSLMLIDSPYPFLRISLKVIIPVVLTTAAFFAFAVGFGLKAQKRRPTTGAQGLIGETGKTITAVGPKGQALIHGEYWSVQSAEPIEKGESVQVVDMDGLTLHVIRYHAKEADDA